MKTVDRRHELDGKEVAITGRLASMSKEEARQLILDAGGAIASVPGSNTALLMVGQASPPLGEDGQLDRQLRHAERLRHQGVDIEVVSEEDFLTRLGLEERHGDLHRLYTTSQLSRILGVPAQQIRAWVRHELIKPVKVVRRLCFFDFPQVASAKALSQLAAAGVKPARIRQSLEQLGDWLEPQDRLLTQLETLEGGSVAVRTSEGRLAEASGQLRLDFEEEEPTRHELRPVASMPSADWREQEWFEAGVLAEDEGRLDEASRHYRRAIELGGAEAEIRFNLGNVLYALEEKGEAIEMFQEAVRIDPDYVEAWNNLGNALTDIGRLSDALRAYERALQIEPAYADAHYNLAETWAAHGDLTEARREWRAYLELDPSSTWSDVVRLRLQRSKRKVHQADALRSDS